MATTSDAQSTITTYVTDMIALERHSSAPLEKQSNDDETKKYPQAQAFVAKAKSITDAHITALESLLQTLGGSGSAGVKSTVAGALGAVAAGINDLRKEQVSKSLRDDYTALSLHAISYEMLHTTALGVGDSATAALAAKHLDDTSTLIVELGRLIPRVVLEELANLGIPVQTGAASQAEATVNKIWAGSPN
jgi:ferritin-like metal-binding protein YciE